NGDSDLLHFVGFNGQLFFAKGEGPAALWRSDGTAAGTDQLKAFAGPDEASASNLRPCGTVMFLSGDDGVVGLELWKTTGTSAGTSRVKDINPGPTGSHLELFTCLAGRLVFTANDGTTGTELWRSDGTSATTDRVKDINPLGASSSPTLLTKLGSTI